MPTNDENHAVPSVEMEKLLRLPNGSWVKPSAVTAVKKFATETGVLGELYRARVIVRYGNSTESILANDDDHAQAMADEIACEINGEVPASDNHAAIVEALEKKNAELVLQLETAVRNFKELAAHHNQHCTCNEIY